MKIPLLFLLLLLPFSLFAQESAGKESYQSAEKAYRDGRFLQAVNILQQDMPSYEEALLPSACRLLALCSLALDHKEDAVKYVRLMLRYNPYYVISLDDPVRFADMVRQYSAGQQMLVTASQQLESLDETPVPVTLITPEMIQASGADNLKDLLTTFVPGITAVEGNSELNLAMHGIYTSEQQKILIMLDGHRLNSRSTNAQAPDYSISLNKIRQIEVLRGPASSLYGNVALAAVVNIITWEGREADGASLSLGIGESSTYSADFMLGKAGPSTDLLVWSSVYTSQGDIVHFPADARNVWRYYPIDGNIYLNGFNDKPSYDIGCRIRWNDHWKIYLNMQHAKMQSVYTYVAIKAPYTYEKYRHINGEKPGHSRTSLRGELQYSNHWKDWSLDVNCYIDMDRQMNYEADGDSLPDGFIVSLPPGEILDSVVAKSGFFQTNSWDDLTFGATLKGCYTYGGDTRNHGTLLGGIQLENYTMSSTDACVGDQFDRITVTLSEHNGQIRLGSEWSCSAFLQGKHCFTPRLIVNAGLRYDFKHRFNGKSIQAFSPRLALICKAGHWSFKACYARSFVDAPYFYRASTVKTYRGSENLKPEYLDALQLTGILTMPDAHLSYDCNLYYNHLSDLIYYNKSAVSADCSVPVYSNAGSLDLVGCENSLSFTPPGWNIYANLTWQRVLKSHNYIVTGHSVNGIPAVAMNIVAAKSLFNRKTHALWLNAGLSCYSRQHMAVSAYRDGILYTDDAYVIKGSAILNLGLRYSFHRIETTFSCTNVFDTRYTRASLYDIDVLQQGRNLMWNISYTF